MNINIEKLFSEDLVKRLRRAKLSDASRILTTSYQKFKEHGFTCAEFQSIQQKVAKDFAPPSVKNAECISSNYRKWKRITTGCSALDKILDKGISNFGITEICGESGSGKSQICLQLAVSVQLPEHLGGFGLGAVYISTEDTVPTSRTLDIAKYYQKLHGGEVDCIDFNDNIFIDHVYDVYELLECVTKRLPFLMEQHQIGIIIIDSVGAIFRVENDYIKRANHMRELCSFLLKLSEEYDCAVVCVNQVTSFKSTNTPENQFVPCLGLAWANLVNTRLQIHRTNKSVYVRNGTQMISHPIRKMEVLFGSELKPDSANFLITSNGVNDVHLFS